MRPGSESNRTGRLLNAPDGFAARGEPGSLNRPIDVEEPLTEINAVVAAATTKKAPCGAASAITAVAGEEGRAQSAHELRLGEDLDIRLEGAAEGPGEAAVEGHAAR